MANTNELKGIFVEFLSQIALIGHSPYLTCLLLMYYSVCVPLFLLFVLFYRFGFVHLYFKERGKGVGGEEMRSWEIRTRDQK